MIRSATAGVKAAARPAPKIGVPFAPIPLDVKARRDLSPAAKLVFATLANQARMRRGDVSNLTNNQIAARDGLNVASVRRALDQLEAAGLIRRLWGASQRVRLGVAIVYTPAEGVAQDEQPRGARVAHPAQPGCAPASDGGCAPGATDLLRRGEEPLKTGATPSTGGEEDDPAARVAEGPVAAAYLRACIAAARSGGKPLPCPTPTAPVEVPKPPTTATPGKAPGVPQDDASREVGRMVRDLGQALRSETVGRWQGRQSADVQSRRLDAWRRGRKAVHAPLMNPPSESIGAPVMSGAWKQKIALNPPALTTDPQRREGASCAAHDAPEPEGRTWKSSRS